MGLNLLTSFISNCKDLILHYATQLSELLLKGVTEKVSTEVHQSITLLRYFELACQLAAMSAPIFESIAAKAVQTVFSQYFQYDMLT